MTSPQVDEKYGQVKVRDTGGTLITVFAVVDPGQPPIPRDADVILVEYDEKRKVFIVVPSDMDVWGGVCLSVVVIAITRSGKVRIITVYKDHPQVE